MIGHMRLLRRVACVLRGGHPWETTTDVVGSITACTRCGTVSHGRKSVSGAGSPQGVAEDAVWNFEARHPGP